MEMVRSAASFLPATSSTGTFASECSRRVDDNLRAYFLSMTSNRWLAVRLEFLGALVVFATGYLMVSSRVDSSVIGLTMSYEIGRAHV